MKKIKHTLLLFLTLLAACNQEEEIKMERLSTLELEINAENFLPASNTPNTRISEGGTGGYVTTFSSGDQIGITAVKEGKIVDGMNNIACTYDGAKWTPASGKLFFYEDTEYIAYYPYQAAMNDKMTINDIVAAFAPQINQSDYTTGYSQSCLMTATETANATTKKLSFTFAHAMAMLELQFKQILNGNPATTLMADAGSTLKVTSGGNDYTFNEQTTGARYRMMLKPGETFGFDFSYAIGNVSYTYTTTGLTMPAAGKYIHYDLKHTQTNVTLDAGSYEGALGDISKIAMDGAACKAVKQTGSIYKIVMPGNDVPVAISRLDIYINDNKANAECLLVSTTNVTVDSSTGKISVTLSKGGMEGAGTSAADPYRVTTPPQLRGVGVEGTDNDNAETEYYEQKNDLDLSIYTDWTPVKSGLLYDGKHFKVNNLTSTQGGIFSHNGGTIQNVHLASGNINKNGNTAGGIINNNSGSSKYVYNCSNAASITANEYAGGIAASHSNGTIMHCKNSGTITGRTAGGITGSVFDGGSQTRYCYNTGQINARNDGHNDGCGGLSGLAWGGTYYCYSTGTVTGDGNLGSLWGSLTGDQRVFYSWANSKPFAGGTDTAGNNNWASVFNASTNSWPVYNAGTGDGWTSEHWKPFTNGEYPKLLWE